LLFYLCFLGIGNGMRLVMYGPYLADLIPAERMGEFTRLSASAETIGVFLAALLTGALINLNVFGWRYRIVFVLTGIFVLLGFVAVLFVAPKLLSPPAS
jgi:MFS family permease